MEKLGLHELILHVFEESIYNLLCTHIGSMEMFVHLLHEQILHVYGEDLFSLLCIHIEYMQILCLHELILYAF